MKVVCMECGRQKAGTSGDPISHGLCARCEIASNEYRGGSIDKVKKDPEILRELKRSVEEELEGVKWVPPDDNPNWKDREFNKEDLDFYNELVNQVETEESIGNKK